MDPHKRHRRQRKHDNADGHLFAREALMIVVGFCFRRFMREDGLQTDGRNGDEVEQLQHRGERAVLGLGVFDERMHRVRSEAGNAGGDGEPAALAQEGEFGFAFGHQIFLRPTRFV